MRIGTFTAALHAVGLDVTIDDLRAVFWLAQHLPGARQVAGDPDPAALALPVQSAPLVSPSNEGVATVLPDEIRDRGTVINVHGQAPQSVNLFARKQGDGQTARSVRLRGQPALPQSLAIGRALRPVLRRRPGRELVMDEQATAELVAQCHVPVVVYRTVRERWFDIVLITEQTASSAAWLPVQAQFEHLLRRVGSFRDVRALRLHADACSLALTGSDGASVAPDELRDRTGRTLLLVLSDCTSVAWHEGLVGAWLWRLARTMPVAVGQLLPPSLWPNTAVGFAELRVHAAGLAMATQRLQVRRPTWALDEPGIVMPVFALTPAMLHEWAGMTAGAGRAWCSAALLPCAEPGAASFVERPLGELPSGEQVLKHFRAFADRDARMLAGYYAGVRPLTAPVMRVIHSAMAPDSGPAAMAQVLLGGLLYPVSASGKMRCEPDSIEYEFYPGLREALLLTVSESDIVRINMALHGYLVKICGTPFDFAALVADPAGTERLPEAALPFAKFAREQMQRVGGHRFGSFRRRAEMHRLCISIVSLSFKFAYSGGAVSQEWLLYGQHLIERTFHETEMGDAFKPTSTDTRPPIPLGLINALRAGSDDAFCELVLAPECMHVPWEAMITLAGIDSDLRLLRYGWTRRRPDEPAAKPVVQGGHALVIGLAGGMSTAPQKPPVVPPGIVARLHVLTGASPDVLSANTYTDVSWARPPRIVHLQQIDWREVMPVAANEDPAAAAVRWALQAFGYGTLMPELIVIDHAYAADIASSLIGCGASIVIAAPIEEDSGKSAVFIETVYEELANGATYIDAVRAARLAGPTKTNISNGRIVCYGDPSWRFQAARHQNASNNDELASVAPETQALHILVTGLDGSLQWLQPALKDAYGGRQNIFFEYIRYDADVDELERIFGSAWPDLEKWSAVLFFSGSQSGPSWMEWHNGGDRPLAQESLYVEAVRQHKPILGILTSGANHAVSDVPGRFNPFSERPERMQRLLQTPSRTRLMDGVYDYIDTLRGEVKPDDALLSNERRYAQDVHKALNEPAWVLVAGSSTKNVMNKKVADTCSELGAALARAGLKLITGGQRGVDEAVARSYAAELDGLYVSVDNRLAQVVSKVDPAFGRGMILRSGVDGIDYADCVTFARYLVLVGGYAGTRKVAESAPNMRCIVLPLADTAGEARRFHKSLRTQGAQARHPFLSNAMVHALSARAPGVGTTVVDIIRELERTREAHHVIPQSPRR